MLAVIVALALAFVAVVFLFASGRATGQGLEETSKSTLRIGLAALILALIVARWA